MCTSPKPKKMDQDFSHILMFEESDSMGNQFALAFVILFLACQCGQTHSIAKYANRKERRKSPFNLRFQWSGGGGGDGGGRGSRKSPSLAHTGWILFQPHPPFLMISRGFRSFSLFERSLFISPSSFFSSPLSHSCNISLVQSYHHYDHACSTHMQIAEPFKRKYSGSIAWNGSFFVIGYEARRPKK